VYILAESWLKRCLNRLGLEFLREIDYLFLDIFKPEERVLLLKYFERNVGFDLLYEYSIIQYIIFTGDYGVEED
jgi:hypothetical protein